jgi:hypothetical protein
MAVFCFFLFNLVVLVFGVVGVFLGVFLVLVVCLVVSFFGAAQNILMREFGIAELI